MTTRHGDGTTWEDEHIFHIYWDSGVWPDTSPTGPDDHCIENLSALVWKSGSTVEDAMFFNLQDDDQCGATGLDDDGDNVNNEGAIVYAKHMN